jgi:hypothetical protein
VTLTSFHKERYGEWAGQPKGRAADPSRCAEEVFPSGRGELHHQCHRPRGFGPEGAFCKQHSPDAKAERKAKAAEKWEIEKRKWRDQHFGKTFREALEQIEAGHNDPRFVAREVLERWRK